MESYKAIIALNGESHGSKEDYLSFLSSKDHLFIGADGGTKLFSKLNIKPDLIIGDLDSLNNQEIQQYINKGVEILEYPVEKDETDAELAINYCYENNIKNISFIGGLGGRIDQNLANVFLLEYALQKNIKATFREPNLMVGLIGAKRYFKNWKNARLSLLPLDQEVTNVVIKGCKYNLSGKNLYRYHTLGISNLIMSNEAIVQKSSGKLLFVLEKTKEE